MIINHNMRSLLIFPHMLLKMFVKYVPRTPVQRSSGGPNVGEICSSSNRPITRQPHASSVLPTAFAAVLVFHQSERIAEHMQSPEH